MRASSPTTKATPARHLECISVPPSASRTAVARMYMHMHTYMCSPLWCVQGRLMQRTGYLKLLPLLEKLPFDKGELRLGPKLKPGLIGTGTIIADMPHPMAL